MGLFSKIVLIIIDFGISSPRTRKLDIIQEYKLCTCINCMKIIIYASVLNLCSFSFILCEEINLFYLWIVRNLSILILKVVFMEGCDLCHIFIPIHLFFFDFLNFIKILQVLIASYLYIFYVFIDIRYFHRFFSFSS